MVGCWSELYIEAECSLIDTMTPSASIVSNLRSFDYSLAQNKIMHCSAFLYVIYLFNLIHFDDRTQDGVVRSFKLILFMMSIFAFKFSWNWKSFNHSRSCNSCDATCLAIKLKNCSSTYRFSSCSIQNQFAFSAFVGISFFSIYSSPMVAKSFQSLEKVKLVIGKTS